MIVDSYFSDSKYGNVKNENNAATRLLYVQLERLFWRLIPSISLMLGIKYSKLQNYFICPLIWGEIHIDIHVSLIYIQIITKKSSTDKLGLLYQINPYYYVHW